MHTSELLIQNAISRKTIKALALFYKWKAECISGVLKDSNYSELARRTGVSFPTAKKYVKQLHSMELVKSVDGDVVFLSNRKVLSLSGYHYEKERDFIHYCSLPKAELRKRRLNEVILLLYSKIIEQESRQQIYKQAKTRKDDSAHQSEIAPMSNSKDYRNANTEISPVYFSDKQLSKKLSISCRTFKRRKKELKAMNLFTMVTRNPQLLKTQFDYALFLSLAERMKNFQDYYHISAFYSRGNVFRSFRTQYVCNYLLLNRNKFAPTGLWDETSRLRQAWA